MIHRQSKQTEVIICVSYKSLDLVHALASIFRDFNVMCERKGRIVLMIGECARAPDDCMRKNKEYLLYMLLLLLLVFLSHQYSTCDNLEWSDFPLAGAVNG